MRPAILATLLVLGSGCAKEVLVHQQDEKNANHILHVLWEEAAIGADKVKDEESRELRFNITVAKDDSARALTVLERHGLPEKLKMGTTDTNGGGIIPTHEEEKAKRESGIKGDIENGMRRIPGIIDATAYVSIPDDNPLRDVNEAKPKPKASVTLIYQPGPDNAPPVTVEEIRAQVQAALPDLTTKEVAVDLIAYRDTASKRPAAGSTANGPAAPEGAPPILNGCEKDTVLGIEVCADSKRRLYNVLVGAVLIAASLAAATVVTALRAMRYRKDLTRLTAQVAQLRK